MAGKRIRMNEVKEWKQERLFTQWLSEHIDLVGEVIHKTIVSATTEENNSEKYGKGKYPVDILAIDEDGKRIVIENQYFLSNHIHLGEVITYAAWHDASILVWITEDVDEEHLKAVKYINNIAKTSNIDFEFWLLLVKPDEETDLVNSPNIELKVAEETDIKKKNELTFIPTNAELNVLFWNEFEKELARSASFSLFRQKRTDCIGLGWGKSYNMNIPFRSNNIKIEVHFKKYGEIFYDEIEKDFEKIIQELELEKYDKVELIQSPTQIIVTIPAKVTCTCNWDKYISKMIKIIVCLREIADRYECCY